MPLRALLAVALCAAAAASADERFDHNGSLGLILGGGLEDKTQSPPDSGLRGDVDVGLTVAPWHNGSDALLVARATIGGDAIDWSVWGGYRGNFGLDRFKTFLDLDLAVHVGPVFSLGPRVGIGAQYELTSVVGVYLSLAGQLAFAPGTIRFGVELGGGLQFRTYLLE